MAAVKRAGGVMGWLNKRRRNAAKGIHKPGSRVPPAWLDGLAGPLCFVVDACPEALAELTDAAR